MCLLREKSNFILKVKRVKREKGKHRTKSEGKKVVKSLWKRNPEKEFCAWSGLAKVRINLIE